MNKKLNALTLLLFTAVTAVGCSDVKYKEVLDGDKSGQSIIYSLKNNSVTEYFTADDLLKELQDGVTATNTIYNQISRQVFTIYADQVLSADKISSIADDADDQVEEFKTDCKSSAKSNGTDYDTYLESRLSSMGVSTLEDLKELYIYNGKKSAILEDYVEDHYDYFLDKYLTAYTPFQVKHILVAANSSNTAYVNGTMTDANARKLVSILNRFKAGDSFASIADLTDDTTSKDHGGIMPFNQAQNYVQEFRFAPYAIELFSDTSVSVEDKYAKANELHILSSDSESSDYVTLEEFEDSDFYQIYNGGIETIDVNDILALEGDVTAKMAGAYNYYTDAAGTLKPGATAPSIIDQEYIMNVSEYNDAGEKNVKYYSQYQLQRNKIFNQTVNTHKVKYIEVDDTWVNKTDVNGVTVMADAPDGNPVYVVLASTGIHLMANVWNSYANTKEENASYFKLFDSASENYKADYENSYIGRNLSYLNKSTLEANSKSLLSDVSSYVSTLEYFLFNALAYDDSATSLEPEKSIDISFYDDEIGKAIKDFVEEQINSTDDSFASSVKRAAETYGSMLAREAEMKAFITSWLWDEDGEGVAQYA